MVLPVAVALSGIQEEYFEDVLISEVLRSGAVLFKSPNLQPEVPESTSQPPYLFPTAPPTRLNAPPHKTTLSVPPSFPAILEESNNDVHSQCLQFESNKNLTPVARPKNLGPYFDLLMMSDQIELTQVHPASCHPSTSRAGTSYTAAVKAVTPEVVKPAAPELEKTAAASTASTATATDAAGAASAPDAQPTPPEPPKIMYQNRDILDLGSNISWNPITPARLRETTTNYFMNRSQFSRVLGAQLPPHDVHVCPFPDCQYHEYSY